jgi:hypothetical protein
MATHDDSERDVRKITELLYRYGRAIDRRDIEDLRNVFTHDAMIEYAFEQGTKLDVQKMIPWLGRALRIFRMTDHVITEPRVDLAGDSAHSTCRLVASHIQVELDGSERTVIEAGTYTDEHVRTSEGWRIRARRLDRQWVDGEYLPPAKVKLFDRPSGPQREA